MANETFEPVLTKEQFADYRACQNRGTFNMFDHSSYKRARMTKLSSEQWTEAIKHYSEYKELYKI